MEAENGESSNKENYCFFLKRRAKDWHSNPAQAFNDPNRLFSGLKAIWQPEAQPQAHSQV
jgi:hypothetical protein